jgi:hypothetical protein
MTFVDPDDASRSAPPGTALPTAVKVTDWDGTAVQGAHVTFVAPVIEGTPTIVGTATSNSDGVAQILWTISAGPNVVVATGRGIAAQNNYPNAVVKPFMPDIDAEGAESPVALGTGRVTFLATGATETFPSLTVLTGLEYPKGLWISHFDAYLTETAGHNTSFGGKNTLLHWTPDGGILQTLLTNPVNSDAVGLTSDGSIYAAGYVGSIPGEVGLVSHPVFNGDLGQWVEIPVADVAIAVNDMFVDGNDDIYVIGESDNADATNLYRLPAGSYDAPEGVATSLGRATAMTKVGTSIYYSNISEIRRLDDGINELVLTHASVTSLTSDGTFLYYGDLAGTIRRRNISTGADEQVTTGPGEITAVRYDPSSGRLYYLRSGTADSQYKNGSLNYITVNTPIQ